MKTVATDPNQKRATLPFIGRCLKDMGMYATRGGNSYYVDLGYESNLVISLQRGRISVAVVMPAGWEDIEEQLVLASMTMARTRLVKVFLCPEEDEMNIWFSAESFCKTRGDFEIVFDALFNLLMRSVRLFLKIRDRMAKGMKALSMAEFMMSRTESQKPS